MKRFAELGIKVDDDRRIYNCQKVSISDILNVDVEILGYLKDIKTQHGDNRYLIHFRECSNGQEGKFFTNSTTMKNVLDAISEDDYPFITCIKAVDCGGRNKMYVFT